MNQRGRDVPAVFVTAVLGHAALHVRRNDRTERLMYVSHDTKLLSLACLGSVLGTTALPGAAVPVQLLRVTA
ncbi:MAG TPA: hypothetical protein VNN08_25685, partial [Thermoanaerobaculia bacterium]|nr:hypothetical protein [Thermoanaerobaculia bacterium]